MAKVATLITDMFEDVEYTEPAKALTDAGHEVFTIEKEAGKVVTGKNGEAKVNIDHNIDDVNPADFDALFLPGGFSPDILNLLSHTPSSLTRGSSLSVFFFF